MKYASLLGLCLGIVFFHGSAVASYRMEPAVGPAGPELTSQFAALFSSRARVSAAQLRAYRVVFVPGFNADYLERNKGYFADYRRELKRLGLQEGTDFEVLRHQHGFHGERNMAHNARAIAEYILASDRPLLIITHSKGGIDLLEALLRTPEARLKVKGWFSVQSAMGGTILADILSRGWTRPVVEIFLRGYGGSIEALEDMRRETRRSYLETNLSEIERITREVPMVALTTRKDHNDMPLDLRTLVTLFDPYFFRDESDGMIEMGNSMIPGAPWVFLDGVDHGEVTQRSGRFDRVGCLHAMLASLLPATNAANSPAQLVTGETR